MSAFHCISNLHHSKSISAKARISNIETAVCEMGAWSTMKKIMMYSGSGLKRQLLSQLHACPFLLLLVYRLLLRTNVPRSPHHSSLILQRSVLHRLMPLLRRSIPRLIRSKPPLCYAVPNTTNSALSSPFTRKRTSLSLLLHQTAENSLADTQAAQRSGTLVGQKSTRNDDPAAANFQSTANLLQPAPKVVAPAASLATTDLKHITSSADLQPASSAIATDAQSASSPGSELQFTSSASTNIQPASLSASLFSYYH